MDIETFAHYAKVSVCREVMKSVRLCRKVIVDFFTGGYNAYMYWQVRNCFQFLVTLCGMVVKDGSHTFEEAAPCVRCLLGLDQIIDIYDLPSAGGSAGIY